MLKKVISLKPLLNFLQSIVLTVNVKLRAVRISLRTYMLFAGWEVRMVKNCDRGLENTSENTS